MLSLPWYIKWGAIAALCAAAWGHGYVTRMKGDATFTAEVNAAGSAQNARSAVIVKSGQAISQQTGESYAKAAVNLRHAYGAGRVSHAVAGGGDVSIVSGITPGTQGDSSYCRSSPEYAALKSDAAVTTLQLFRVLDWIELQSALWGLPIQ